MGRQRSLSSPVFRHLVVAGCLVGLVAVAPVSVRVAGDAAPSFSWQILESDSESSTFNSVDGVSPEVAWVAGRRRNHRHLKVGQVLLTVDGGVTFADVEPPPRTLDGMEFIDIEASSAEHALVLGAFLSRAGIFRTTNGGITWTETFHSDTGALSCMAMFDHREGFVLAGPVDGKFQVLRTIDGGRSWAFIPGAGMPDALFQRVPDYPER